MSTPVTWRPRWRLAAARPLCKHRFHYRTDAETGGPHVDMTNQQQVFEFADRFIAALNAGDAAKARTFYQPDATCWHNFDDVDQGLDDNMKLLEWMVRKVPDRHYRVVRRELIPGGWLQQHILEARLPNGREMKMFACCVITLRDGLIQRIEEYLDPAQAAVLREAKAS